MTVRTRAYHMPIRIRASGPPRAMPSPAQGRGSGPPLRTGPTLRVGYQPAFTPL